MEDLTKYSPTELLKIINDTKVKHDRLKQEIFNHLTEIDKIEIEINKKILELTEEEKYYVELVDELNKR
jgi:hypothetical protein